MITLILPPTMRVRIYDQLISIESLNAMSEFRTFCIIYVFEDGISFASTLKHTACHLYQYADPSCIERIMKDVVSMVDSELVAPLYPMQDLLSSKL